MDEVPDKERMQDMTSAPGAADESRGDQAASEASGAAMSAAVEAILFACDSPLSAARIADVSQLGGQRDVKRAIAVLNARYERVGAAHRIEELAGGYQMLTLPEFHDMLGRLFRARSETKLSQAALEALAIIAYRQPILRADIEGIRGVASGEVLRGLMDKQLVKIVGRAEVLGRPMLYGTTRRFLEVFGLASLEDLPRVEELRSGATRPSPAAGSEPSGKDDAAPQDEPLAMDDQSATASPPARASDADRPPSTPSLGADLAPSPTQAT